MVADTINPQLKMIRITNPNQQSRYDFKSLPTLLFIHQSPFKSPFFS